MKYKRLLLIIALSLVMIVALLKLGRIEISRDTLARIHWGWYGLVIVSFYASVVARGWRWQWILRAIGWPVSLGYATTLLIAGLFLSAVLPGRAGDIGRVAMLKQDHQMPVAKGIASIAAERVLDVTAILILAILAAALALPGRIPAEALQLMLGVGGVLIAGLVILLIIPGLQTWLREFRLIRKIIPVKLWPAYTKILDFGFALIDGIRVLGQKPAALALIIGQSFFIWWWDGVIIYLILVSLEQAQPFGAALFTAMVGALATAVPLTPGALGQYDAAIISLLALFGVSTATAGLAVLLLRLVQLWTFIPVSGLMTYVFGFARALNLKSSEVEPVSPGPLPAES